MNYYDEIKEKLLKNEIYAKVKDYSKERNKVLTYFEVGKLLSDVGKEYGNDIIGQYAEKLVNEVGRKVIPASAFAFLFFFFRVSSTPTNVLQITLTFGANDCNGDWREFAIYGGNATSTLGTGIMINHKTHALLVKTNTIQVQRQIKFTFNNNN